MAFGRLQRSGSSQPMSDINMTPLIDVMLVLLVIFIITAPLMSNSLRLDLPNAAGAQAGSAAQFVVWQSTRKASCSGVTSRWQTRC